MTGWPGASWPTCGRWTAANTATTRPAPTRCGVVGASSWAVMPWPTRRAACWVQAQEQWLTKGLTQSQRRWKLMAQSTLMASSGIQTPLGRSAFTDGWDGYPQARSRLLQTVADARLSDVVMLGGDVHANVAAQLRVRPGDERSPVVASELVTTSVSTRGMSPKLMAQIQRDNPDIRHARSDERGYTLIDIRPDRWRRSSGPPRTRPSPAPGWRCKGVGRCARAWRASSRVLEKTRLYPRVTMQSFFGLHG
jgi:hypothetical protein